MRVGFVGLGRMGGPMSGNLLAAGHDLIVHDARAAAAGPLCEAGASWAATPRLAAAGREIVITSLPAPRDVEAVLLGDGGLLDGLEPGSVWVDMSTSVPEVADRVRALAEPRGVAVIDAPVSGMTSGAREGRCRSSWAAPSMTTTGSGPCSRPWATPGGSGMWVRTVPDTRSSSC